MFVYVYFVERRVRYKIGLSDVRKNKLGVEIRGWGLERTKTNNEGRGRESAILS